MYLRIISIAFHFLPLLIKLHASKILNHHKVLVNPIQMLEGKKKTELDGYLFIELNFLDCFSLKRDKYPYFNGWDHLILSLISTPSPTNIKYDGGPLHLI